MAPAVVPVLVAKGFEKPVAKAAEEVMSFAMVGEDLLLEGLSKAAL